jgi:DNA-binding IscR family transcriptional regulator
MRLNRQLQLAINLISLLTDAPQTAESLALQLEVTEIYISKIACMLARTGLIKSLRGPNRGYVKSSPIPVVKLFNLFQGSDLPTTGKAAEIKRQVESSLNHIQL